MENPDKDTASEVKEFIAKQLSLPIEQISLSSKIDDLTNDSIQLFELLIGFEKYYQVKTSYEDVVQLNTVEDIVKYVDTKVR